MPTSFKAILFDMDGTLIDTLPFIIQALQETFQRYAGRQFTRAEIIAMFGPSEPGIIRLLVPEAAVKQAVAYFHARYESLHPSAPDPFPGVIDLLKALRAHGIKTGVVTGKGAHTAQISLKAYGLDALVDGMVSGSINGGEKPQSIQKILAGWGFPPEAAAYVGDMTSDMRDARAAGVTALGAAWAGLSMIDDPAGGMVFQTAKDLQHYLLGTG